MRLSDAEIQALQPKAKLYKVFFGQGLFVQVSPNGSKYWRLKYHLSGKEGTYAIGVYPEVSVAEALEAKQAARHMIRKGENPTAIKREAAIEAKKHETKPPSDTAFSLTLGVTGGLTIETEAKLMKITPSQTDALRRFLNAKPSARREHEQC